MVLVNELRILEEQKGAAPAKRYESLSRRALRAGHEGFALTVLAILAQKYDDEGDKRRRRIAFKKAKQLSNVESPANLAAVELGRRLGVANGVPPDHQTRAIKETLAYEIHLARYARLGQARVQEFQALHDRAMGEGKHLEAALCDLFLISEYRREGASGAERQVIADLKRLEAEFGVRDYEGKPYTDELASRKKRR